MASINENLKRIISRLVKAREGKGDHNISNYRKRLHVVEAEHRLRTLPR